MFMKWNILKNVYDITKYNTIEFFPDSLSTLSKFDEKEKMGLKEPKPILKALDVNFFYFHGFLSYFSVVFTQKFDKSPTRLCRFAEFAWLDEYLISKKFKFCRKLRLEVNIFWITICNQFE